MGGKNKGKQGWRRNCVLNVPTQACCVGGNLIKPQSAVITDISATVGGLVTERCQSLLLYICNLLPMDTLLRRSCSVIILLLY